MATCSAKRGKLDCPTPKPGTVTLGTFAGAGAVGPSFLSGWLLVVVAPAALAVVGATLRRSPRAALAGAAAAVSAFVVATVLVNATLPADDAAFLLVPVSVLAFPVFGATVWYARPRLRDPPYAATSGRAFAVVVGLVACWGLGISSLLLATAGRDVVGSAIGSSDGPVTLLLYVGVPVTTGLVDGLVLVDLVTEWRSPDRIRRRARR